MATTPEGLAYIRARLASGDTKQQITAALIAGGWREGDVLEALNAVAPAPAPAPVSTPAPNATATTPKIAYTPAVPASSAPVQMMPHISVPAETAIPATAPAPAPVQMPHIPVVPVASEYSRPLGTLPPRVSLPDVMKVRYPNNPASISTMMTAEAEARRRRFHPLRWLAWFLFFIFMIALSAVLGYLFALHRLTLLEQYVPILQKLHI